MVSFQQVKDVTLILQAIQSNDGQAAEEMLVKDAKVTIYPENLKHVADFPIRKPSDATFSPED